MPKKSSTSPRTMFSSARHRWPLRPASGVWRSSRCDSARPRGLRAAGSGAKLVAGASNASPADTVGKRAVRGPTGCRYLADSRQSNYVRDGWNLTGDSFVRDATGRLSFVARSDDMIVSSGYNIAGPEVEAALLSHPAVAECGVVGAPDEARGMIVKAYVVLAGGAAADAALTPALQDHVKQPIAPYKYPDRK